MEVYRTTSKEVQEIILANVTYEVVIEGLNGYFASEPRNDYITVKMESDKQDFALYEAEAWADILISWLRTEHEIFYYPGMEAKYAKMERIPPFTERMMDEGALNSLKALYKRVIGQAVGINSHTLIADSIKCAINAKESEIEKMKERIAELEYNFKAVCDEDDIFRTRALKAEEEVKKLKKEVESAQKEVVCKDIMNYIRYESSRNGFDLPEEIDGEPLTIKRVFHDLLELLRKKETDIKEARKKHWNDLRDIHKALGRDGTCDSIDGFAKAVKARAEYVESLARNVERETQKSDTNKLIRDYCTKHDIVAPSRYLGDEACVDYLFSVSVSILQDLYRDIFKKQPNGLSAKDIATKILDKVSTKDDEISQLKALINAIDSVKESRGKIRAEIENYKLSLKDYILKDIKENGYRYDGLETKSIEEIVDWIIMLAACDRSGIALKDIYATVASPVERRRYNIDDCDGEIVDHMKDYILRRFEGLRINIEYCLKKMSELDGYKKHFETLKEKQEFLSKQNMELSCKLCAKDDEISRLKGLINAMNEEVGDM